MKLYLKNVSKYIFSLLRNTFLKNLAQTSFAILLRNSLKIRIVPINIKNLKFASVSDAFIWRTDNNYITKFKYSDLYNIFYNIKNSWVEIHFYTKDNKLIKRIEINNLKLSNEIVISPQLLNGAKDYGNFYIYHFTKDKIKGENIIFNKCYIGFSLNKNLFSFVHGNTLARYKDNINTNIEFTDLVQTSIFTNYFYKIQKYFDVNFNNELFFTNPTSKNIKFSIGSLHYNLKKGCSKIIIVKSNIVEIKSNCAFLRPFIFSYKDKYLDVHHS